MSTDNDNILFGNGDELPSNRSGNIHIQDVINLGRRQVLAGGASLGALAFLGAALPEPVQAAGRSEWLRNFPLKRRSRLPFSAVPVSRHDGISVPPEYTATTFIPWGTPISGRYPAYLEDASNSAEDQAHQIGMHHDGMHFFPINAKYGGYQSDHGLLVVVGPLGAEVTGITATPDFRTLFVNIQHPGEGSTPGNYSSIWPDGPGLRPRSATVIISRKDGKRLM